MTAGRRLILISYHFPPSQAAGALRWEKLATHAVRRGWGVDAVSLHPDDLSARDPSRLEGLPDAVRTFGVRRPVTATLRAWDGLYEVYRRVRPSSSPASQAGTPPTPRVRARPSPRRADVRFDLRDRRAWLRLCESWLEFAQDGAWARATARAARTIFDPGKHRAVVSCGPPHMAHEGARRLAAATGLPLVLDFRDPWSLAEPLLGHMATPLWRYLARHHETRCVRAASLVVMNNELARRAMQDCYPEQSDRIIAIPNGYDDDPLPSVERDGCFRIVYTGSVYLDRNPRALFRAASRLVRELDLTPRQLAIELMGRIVGVDGDLPPEAIAAEEGMADFLTVHPPGPRDQAMRLLARGAVLLNLPQGAHLAVPSKVYEYMRFDAWLLAQAERGSATELLLRDTRADVVEPGDVDALTALLRLRYAEHAAGVRPRPIAADARFSRRVQADRLFDAIERSTTSAGSS